LKSEDLETTMANAFHPSPRSSGLRAVFDWLNGTIRSAGKLSNLSDRDLGDIGIRSAGLSSSVTRDIGRARLVDFGWRLGH